LYIKGSFLLEDFICAKVKENKQKIAFEERKDKIAAKFRFFLGVAHLGMSMVHLPGNMHQA